MHPSAPLAEALENVPSGHGRKAAGFAVHLVISLKPEAIRAATSGLAAL